jgi:hypothetical protein
MGTRYSVNWAVMPMFLISTFDIPETCEDKIEEIVAIDVGDVRDARTV